MMRVITSYIVLPSQDPALELPAVRSLPLLNDKNLPTGRFIGSFGVHSTLKMLATARQALTGNKALRRVEVSVESASARTTYINLEMLPQCDTLHLNLLSPDLREIVRDVLAIKDASQIAQGINHDMALLDTLWADSRFAHCRLFLWNAPMPSNPQFQLGAIAAPEYVGMVRVFNHPSATETGVEFTPAE